MPSIEHTPSLLAQSGIGYHEGYLVIAPPGNPTIRLDIRLLDSIGLLSRPAGAALLQGAVAGGGAILGVLSLVPAGPFVAAGLAVVAHRKLSQGILRRRSRELLLSLGASEVVLHVADGHACAKELVEHLAPYARLAPISSPQSYRDAKRRLAQNGRENPRLLQGMGLQIGEEGVHVEGGNLLIGDSQFSIEHVLECARRGENLPLSGGRLLQAALALLVVAADKRAREGEDLEGLSLRIAEYERWSGRHAGR